MIIETHFSIRRCQHNVLDKSRSPRQFMATIFISSALLITAGCDRAEQPKTDTVTPPSVATETVVDKAVTPNPWALPEPPPKSVYDGPLFTLSHDYPKTPIPAPDPAPWQVAIKNQKITTDNAGAYIDALKNYIAKDMQTFLFDYANWNPAAAHWYNMPWLFDIRDPIHGSYQGSSFPPQMFPQSGLKSTLTTHVFVYYDKVAASSLQAVWGESGMTPETGIKAGGAQFAEGAIIVKPAFGTADANTWPPMAGAYPWKIWAQQSQGQGDKVLQTVYLFQFDIIVKDTKSAPDTGWVFATLVYDNRVAGSMWDKMIPLGAMWGNDPAVKSPQGCDYLKPKGCPPLAQTWINPAAPLYAKETLGWGGRLSGPNDGAVDISAVVQQKDGSLKPYAGRYAMSSCMACHISAEYPMQSFLLPVPATCNKGTDECAPTLASCDDKGNCKIDPNGTSLVYFETGSPDYLRWFQNLPGSVPLDKGTIALDYDMNYAFKALPSWKKHTSATPIKQNFVDSFNSYRGLKHER